MFHCEWQHIHAESERAPDKPHRLRAQTVETTKDTFPFCGYAAPGHRAYFCQVQPGTSLPTPVGRGSPDLPPIVRAEKWNHFAACQQRITAGVWENSRTLWFSRATPP